MMTIAALIVGTALAFDVTQAQQTGIKRTDVQRNDLNLSGREVIQVRARVPYERRFEGDIIRPLALYAFFKYSGSP